MIEDTETPKSADVAGRLDGLVMQERKDNALMHAAGHEERRRCIKELEEFSRDYVLKWIGTQGESVKAEAWAILQAAEHLRDRL